jgi:3-oxoacyl-(acyl-carrier-protein) synthase
MQQVAITGLGIVSCLGDSVEAFWRALCAGECGLRPITRFDPTGLRNENAGEVQDFALSKHLPEHAAAEELAELDEASQFAVAAAWDAWTDAGLATTPPDSDRVGIAFSTNFGGAESWEVYCAELAEGGAKPGLFSRFAFNDAADHTARLLRAGGPKLTLSNSCSSGATAMGAAFDLVRAGRADVVVAGGHDGLGLSSLAGLSILRTISSDTCRPFDKNRSGTVFAEGAGVLVLEDLEHALRRGARVYGRMLGYGVNNNAYHLTAPDKGGAGMVAVLRMALASARIQAGELDYVNAHATGTQYHDVAETQAVKEVLGQRAYEIPMTSIKGATGHGMAAAGAMEALATLLTMRDGILPPTIHYETPDPECDLDCVPNEARAQQVETAISVSAGIGGNNSAVVLRRSLGGGEA